MKLVTTFLIIFLAIQAGTAQHNDVKRGIFDWITDLINKLLNDLKNLVSSVLTGLSTALSNLLSGLNKTVRDLLSSLQNVLNKTLEGINGALDDLVAYIKNIKDGPFASIIAEALAKIETGKNRIAACFNKIQEIAETCGNEYKTEMAKIYTDVVNGVKGQVQRISDVINQGAAEGWDNINDCSRKLLPKLEPYSAKFINDINLCASNSEAKLKTLADEPLKIVSELKSLAEKVSANLKISVDNKDVAGAGTIVQQAGEDLNGLLDQATQAGLDLKNNVAALIGESGTCAYNVYSHAIKLADQMIKDLKTCTGQL